MRYAVVDGLVVILDFRTEDYFVLDEAATTIWEAVLRQRGDAERAADELASRAEGTPDDVRRAVAGFVQDCVDRGFLGVAGGGGAGEGRRARPGLFLRARVCGWGSLTVAAVASLRQTMGMLRRWGFAATHAYYAERIGVAATRRAADEARAVAAFRRAENFARLPNAPDDCLPRSLALFRYLRAVGIACSHHVGVRRYPSMTMHAWVERAGRVLADRPDAREFTPLASIH